MLGLDGINKVIGTLINKDALRHELNDELVNKWNLIILDNQIKPVAFTILVFEHQTSADTLDVSIDHDCNSVTENICFLH